MDLRLMLRTGIFILLSSSPVLAFASFIDNLPTGRLSDISSTGHGANFKIEKNADKGLIALKDIENNMVYRLYLNQPGEQFLPQKYIDSVTHNAEKRGQLGMMINKISVGNIDASGDVLKAAVYLYIQFKSKFGWLNAKVKVGASVKIRQQDLQTQGINPQTYKATVIDTTVGDVFGVEELTSFLPDFYSNLVAFIVDFGFQVTSQVSMQSFQLATPQ